MALKRKRPVHRNDDAAHKRHKFQSFSERIDKLSIDVLRKVRPSIPESGADDEDTYVFSFFSESVKKWRDLNQSATFTELYKTVLPLSESLPQVIHHQEGIMSLLEEFIARQDYLAQISLLDILVQLARDLGEDFYEKYWVRTVILLSPTMNHVEFPVVEAAFNTLSWLLKYLARPLVANLPTTFQELAPLLGKTHQKQYIRRFTSEAFAFLLRRVKAPSEIVTVILEDVDPDNEEYSEAIANIFIESMKAPSRSLHTRAVPLFNALIRTANSSGNEAARNVPLAVIEQVLYDTSKHHFSPILDTILSLLNSECRGLAIDLLLRCCTIKGGARIMDWTSLVAPLTEALTSGGLESSQMCLLSAMVVAKADPITSKTMTVNVFNALKQNDERQIGVFCQLVGNFSESCFHQWVLDEFVKYVNESNEEHFDQICLIMISLKQQSLLVPSDTIDKDGKGRLQGRVLKENSDFVKILLARILESPNISVDQEVGLELWRSLQILDLIGLHSTAVDKATRALLLESLRSDNPVASLVGVLLSIRSNRESNDGTTEVIHLISSQIKGLSSDIEFLGGLEKFLSHLPEKPTASERTSLLNISQNLTRNLSFPSHLIRSIGLRIILHLSNILDPSVHDLLETMLSIENTARTVENIRSTSVAMRKLPLLSTLEHDDMLVAFCFGLLSVSFAPLWKDACNVLKALVDRSGSKIWEFAFSRLTGEDTLATGANANGAAQSIAQNSQTLPFADELWSNSQLKPLTALRSLYEKNLAKNAPDGQTSLRSQSLRALLEIPRLAEQHSRDLVPLFLALEAPSSENSVHWPRNDRISLLTLFTKFANPRGLYKNSLVRSTLYTLLHNGDQKIQTLALDAILTWKDVELVTYKENLHNLLDDKKFREELTSLVHVYADDSPVQEEHRQGLMEVVVRILFGSALVRHGSGEGKRSAILSALANLRPEETRVFIDLALLPFAETHGALEIDDDGFHVIEEILSRYVEERKMMGFVVMVQNLVKALGGGVSPYLVDLLEPLFVCMWKSKLESYNESDVADDDVEFAFDESNTKAARSVRKMSMKLLNLLINTCPDFEWTSYISLIFREFISDKLEALPDENIQSPSNRLQFLETLSKHQQTIFSLSRCDDNALPGILRCIENSKVHISVFNTVLGIFARILQASVDPNIGMSIKDEMVMNHLVSLLEHITVLLTDDHFQHIVNVKQTLDLVIEVLRLSAPLVQTSIHAEHLIEPLLSLLGKPGHLVGEKLKGGILESIVNLLPLCSDFRPDATTYNQRLQAVSQLFGTLNNRAARTMLCQVIDVFAELDLSLKEVGELVTDLNAYDKRRLDTPDFDRRLSAFAKLNEEAYLTLSPQAWTPIVYNMLFFVQDTDEMSLRTGASFALQRFFTMARNNDLSPGFIEILSTAVFPAIKKGFRNSNETVRKEFAGVLNSLVKNCGEWSPIFDLKVLLADGDEEANFFNNIFHIQQHRQLRAITRLSKVAADGLLKASNVEQLFIPMLEKFSLDNNVELHNVTAEATRGIGALSGALGWKSYRQLVKRYISMMKTGDEKERAVVRTVCVVVEMAGKVAAARVQRTSESKVASDLEEHANRQESAEDDFLVRAVVNEFYPPMLRYLHRHEESTLTLRIPVALALVKVLRLLPEQYLISKLPAVLTDVCHILKSRSQEARDTCRKTLNEIMTLLGPRFFSFILKELKTALARGYQLHVLGFTVHSMLTHLPAEFGDLDSCVKDIVDVLVDDIFGVTGAEKDSEGYTTSMKEVKSNKSYDSFEILASITSMTRMYAFISPLKKLLYELGSIKDGRKMNEILRRIQLGILRSKGSQTLAVLEFCISLFKSIQSEAVSSDQPTNEAKPNQFIVDLKFKRKFEVNHFKTNAPKLLRFSLDTITALIRKYEYLVREEQVAELVPVLGDCLMSDVDELRIPALRLLGRMISLPIDSVEEGIDVFVERAVQFIKESPLTKAELCQASIKFLALLIRDRKSYTPKENVVVYLLERIRPDLEEPDRQGVSFTLIRSILSRRLVISEVYDIMSVVGSIMITNQSRSVRDTTRALYLQFLMDYPQGRDRLKKQISFLIKNLQYEHATGRQSVMEVLHQIISKFGDELLQPILLDLFVGLLLPLVNDDSATCREMSSRLIQSIIENADDERSKAIRTMLRLWAQQGDKPALLKASLHVYGLLLEHGTRTADDTDLCIECVTEIVSQSSNESRSGVLWDVTEQALQLFTKLIKIDPSRAFLSDHESMWNVIERLLMCESTGVQLTSSRVVGMFFGRAESLDDGQLKAESLSLGVSSLTALARQFLEQIKSPESTAEIGLQAVKNLIFLGRHFYQTNCSLPRKKADVDDDEDTVKSSFSWLVSRVAAEIRYEHTVAEHIGVARKLLVQWMVAMISILEKDDLLTHAESFISSLSRFMEDGPIASILKSSLKETREIAEEGLKLMQTKLGTTAYLEQYNAVRQDVLGKRQDRKMKRSIEVLNNPERAAKRKIRQHDKTKDNRKRKVEEFRSRRLTHGR